MENTNCTDEIGPVKPHQPDPDSKVTCPDCGTEHSRHINCPTCLMRKGSTTSAFSIGWEKKEKRERRKNKDGDPWDVK